MEHTVLTPAERQKLKNDVISLMNNATRIFRNSVTHADQNLREIFSAQLDFFRRRFFDILDRNDSYNTHDRQINLHMLREAIVQQIIAMKHEADKRVEQMRNTLRTNRQ